MSATTGLIASHRLGRTRLSEFVQTPQMQLESHMHQGLTIFALLSGSNTEVSQGSLARCKPGTIVVKPNGCIHGDVAGAAGFRGIMIEADIELATPPRVNKITLFSDEMMMGDLIGLWSVLENGGSERAASRRLRDFLNLIEDRVGALEPPSWLSEMEDVVRSDLELPVSIPKLARAAGVSISSLQRSFHRHHGQSASEYLWNLRLLCAAEMLEDSDLPIATIAAESGFCDQSHLCRRFKQMFNTSPMMHRRAGRRLLSRPPPCAADAQGAHTEPRENARLSAL